MACVPPVGATVAIDVASPCAPGRRALEDVFVHGQDCEDESAERKKKKQKQRKKEFKKSVKT